MKISMKIYVLEYDINSGGSKVGGIESLNVAAFSSLELAKKATKLEEHTYGADWYKVGNIWFNDFEFSDCDSAWSKRFAITEFDLDSPDQLLLDEITRS